MSSVASRADDAVARELDNIRDSFSLLEPFLNDSEVNDIFIDPFGLVSVKRFGYDIEDVSLIVPERNRVQILNQIARWQGVVIDTNTYPVIEGTIPIPEWNARITGIYPPWVESATIAIRKPSTRVISLEEYVKDGRLSEDRYRTIYDYVKERKNIVIAGGTGSGKTTLANAVIDLMVRFSPQDRFYIVQDNAELQCNGKYPYFLTIRRDQAVSAVLLAMRWSPKRIIFGEVRDGFVMAEILDAWNSGHPGGLTTIHADSAESALLRIRTLLKQRYIGELPDISKVVHLIVHMRGHDKLGVIVDEVLDTRDYSNKYLESLMKRGANGSYQEEYSS